MLINGSSLKLQGKIEIAQGLLMVKPQFEAAKVVELVTKFEKCRLMKLVQYSNFANSSHHKWSVRENPSNYYR